MKTLEQLREIETALSAQMRHVHNSCKALTGRAQAESRDLTQPEQQSLDKLLVQFDEIENEIRTVKAEIANAAQIEDPALRQPQPRQVPAAVYNSATASPYHSPVRGARPASIGGGGATFRDMFGTPVAASREFETLGDFARAVAIRDPRLFNAASGMGEGVGADGGFYVPPEMLSTLWDNSLQTETVRPRATVVPMASKSITIPMIDASNRSTGIGTMEGKVTSEGTTGTTQKLKTREVTLNATKVSILVPVSDELAADSPMLFNQILVRAMGEAMSQTLDSWFLSGSGAGCPLGILNSPCLVSVAKDASQVAATLTPTNLSGMASRLAAGSWAKAVWVVSPSALAQLFVLNTVIKNVAGTENVGGTNHDFFQVLPNGEFSLLGRPLIVSDRMAALGTKGDVLLADLSSYVIGVRQQGELMIDRSIGFKESEQWVRLNVRIDGQPSLAAPITPRVGSATLSTFVTLDART